MSKSPAFQFYPDDFMGGKPGIMTPEQTHVYIWLLCLDWNQHGFTLELPTLARWCRVTPSVFRKAWVVVQDCFSSREGRWFNERLEKEREKQAEWRAKSSKGGKSKRQPPLNDPSEESPTKGPTKPEPKGNTPVSSLQSPTPVTTATATTSHSGRREPTPWMGAIQAVWREVYPSGTPPAGTATALRPLFAKRPEEEVVAWFRTLLTTTQAKYLNIAKAAATYVIPGDSPPVQAPPLGPRSNPADRVSATIAAMTKGGVS